MNATNATTKQARYVKTKRSGLVFQISQEFYSGRVRLVSQTGKAFFTTKENLERLYEPINQHSGPASNGAVCVTQGE